MTRRLEGTVALVTGASSGIGHATALELAREGASVALVGRREDRLTGLAAEITGAGGKALVVPADITTAQAAAEAVERTVEGLGRLDTLVNNAGLMLLGPAPGADLNDWQRMIDINLMGLMYTAHAAVPHLVKAAAEEPRRVADIVNISSLAGRNAYAMSAVYSATKFGVNAFSESLRQELARQHVRVSVIEPGSVDTELRTHNPDVIQQHIVAALG
jgi:NADP-dependent 3-hydroxy acid dehydrogenase YdfG